MPVKFKRSVFKSGDSYRVTIPMPIVKEVELKEKDVLRIWLDNSHIMMEKIRDD